MVCDECGVRLSEDGRELPLTGPEVSGPVHVVERCFAYSQLRAVFVSRFPVPWQVLLEPRPGSLWVTVSRYAGGGGRVCASRVVPEVLVVGAPAARVTYVAEVTAQQMAMELAGKGYEVVA